MTRRRSFGWPASWSWHAPGRGGDHPFRDLSWRARLIATLIGSRRAVWGGILVIAAGWGVSPVGTRAAFDQGLGVHELIGIRSLVALGALGMLFVATGRPIPRSAAVWRVGFVFGTTAMSGGVLFTTLALEHASAGFVGVIVAVSPLVAAVTAHHVGVTERLHVGKVLGLAVSLFGVAVLLLSGDAGLGGEGNALIAAGLMAAVVALATFALFYAKRHAVGLEPLDLAFAQFTSAAVLLVSIMLIGHGLPTGVTAAGWGLTGFLGVVG